MVDRNCRQGSETIERVPNSLGGARVTTVPAAGRRILGDSTSNTPARGRIGSTRPQNAVPGRDDEVGGADVRAHACVKPAFIHLDMDESTPSGWHMEGRGRAGQGRPRPAGCSALFALALALCETRSMMARCLMLA
ncbi:hypothetical protein DCS_01477 [Drechmeria coniospora]|uniref:Uncharacterized protein n=1 Tax=Drechmeria coniospora TaxID=98403 RepID=A0A151GTE0_DRECN|nr:hypothetical protein DCS_01477 [Drechmeria coniospora]KYK60340.1 hypothetical protein DCS_01477 [Drechmeria coniospora]